MAVYSSKRVENTVTNPDYVHGLYRDCLGDAARWNTNYGPKECQSRSMKQLFDLELDAPIRLARGMAIAIYVHSEVSFSITIRVVFVLFESVRHFLYGVFDIFIPLFPLYHYVFTNYVLRQY
jgi:hypothetical protein